ncbi:MAG TPA: hypothetical protein DCR44_04380 [Acholeplasmatales bacterium]|nr:hypothetical protein [Acholeplasmatales bacterium]
MNFVKEFFSWNFTRLPEGLFSWQHLLMVTTVFFIAVFLAVRLSRKTAGADRAAKMKVVIIAAIVLDGLELIKLVNYCILTNSFRILLNYLPLFLCSIPLIVLPIAAFAKGRLQQASLDFVMMFGLLGAVLGTYLAGNIYSIFPVLHFDPMISLATHMTSGFSALYIGLSGLGTMEKKNRGIGVLILGVFMALAFVIDQIGKVAQFQDNYMFLSRADGTPFMILENIFGSGTALYSISVALTMWAYMGAFYLVAELLARRHAGAHRATRRA